MSEFKGIPIVRSGDKYRTENGFSAVKNGVNRRRGSNEIPVERKPDWLRARLPTGAGFHRVRSNVREHRLSTVCEESICPNIGECWNAGTATLMLMGSVCTRACRFCAVDTGNPSGWLDADEPAHAARSVELMGLKYVVLTSVDRDDLADGGAAHYAAAVSAIKARNPDTAIEALTPDFGGDLGAVRTVAAAPLAVFAHNLETVRRLTPEVRDPRAGYDQSLVVLRAAKTVRDDLLTKSSLMLGLGETETEVLRAMDGLRDAGVDILTFGQYLRPTINHLPVQRFLPPREFLRYRELGLQRGFTEVVSGPLVRSSYRAEQALARNNAGLGTATGTTG
ncbi:MAG: lipoyl synthase [Chromatiales bacterium]|nr:MAG: lipoyl synthase [Chromatiales bacterium]